MLDNKTRFEKKKQLELTGISFVFYYLSYIFYKTSDFIALSNEY